MYYYLCHLKCDVCLIVDGSWSAWGAFEPCSKTCGDGEKTRRRVCNNPAPANGGRNCTGENLNTVPCNMQHCPGKIEIKLSKYVIGLLRKTIVT